MPELMKGNVWHERRDAKDRKGNPIVKYPVWVEPKVDEIRVHVKAGVINDAGHKYNDYNDIKFLSYAGKPLANMGQFARAFGWVMLRYGIGEIDCGIQVNKNFNDSYRWVRSTKKLPDDLADAKAVFTLYDLPGFGGDYAARKRLLECIADVLDDLFYAAHGAMVLAHRVCHNAAEVEHEYEVQRSNGHEGVMVKNPRALYCAGKRTDHWLKMKPENDADGVIIRIIEAVCGKDQPDLGLREGDKLGRAGSVEVKLEDGSTATPHGIAHELGEDMWKHPEKYIGQWCEFKYMERDRQGGYRHPTFHRLREAKV